MQSVVEYILAEKHKINKGNSKECQEHQNLRHTYL